MSTYVDPTLIICGFSIVSNELDTAACESTMTGAAGWLRPFFVGRTTPSFYGCVPGSPSSYVLKYSHGRPARSMNGLGSIAPPCASMHSHGPLETSWKGPAGFDAV